jgi:hypothetical protein
MSRTGEELDQLLCGRLIGLQTHRSKYQALRRMLPGCADERAALQRPSRLTWKSVLFDVGKLEDVDYQLGREILALTVSIFRPRSRS